MSIGKRFIEVVRSNLNALLDRAADIDDESQAGRAPIEQLSDRELERELERRRARRAAAQRAAASSSVNEQAWREVEDAIRGGGRFRTSGRRQTRHSNSYQRVHRRPAAGQNPQMARLYAQLECQYGADINSVRKQYRNLMRKYHPDMHSGNPEKQRLATELSQRLTQAYNELRRNLQP